MAQIGTATVRVVPEMSPEWDDLFRVHAFVGAMARFWQAMTHETFMAMTDEQQHTYANMCRVMEEAGVNPRLSVDDDHFVASAGSHIDPFKYYRKEAHDG